MNMLFKSLFLELILTMLVCACNIGSGSESNNSCACTTEFALATVSVETSDGIPINNATLTRKWKETSEVIAVSEDQLMADGFYVIIDDGSKNEIEAGGFRTLELHISAIGHEHYQTDYVIVTDDCQCHIKVEDGPAEIALTYSE